MKPVVEVPVFGLAMRAGQSPSPAFLDPPLPEVDGLDLVDLESLIRFLEHPVRTFLQERLELRTAEEEDEPSDAIPVSPNKLEEWAVGNRLLRAGLAVPTVFEFPHYAASATDYKVVASMFRTRYDRTLYFPGLLSGGTVDHSRLAGQFFPYGVRDVYGTAIVPEATCATPPATRTRTASPSWTAAIPTGSWWRGWAAR